MSNAIPPIAERTDKFEAENETIREAFRILQKRSHDTATKSGFWEEEKYHTSIEAARSLKGNKLMLIAGEVSEAHEELRSGHTFNEIYYNPEKPTKPEGVLPELADVMIREFDTVEHFKDKTDPDRFANAVIEKGVYNASRPYKHGRAF